MLIFRMLLIIFLSATVSLSQGPASNWVFDNMRSMKFNGLNCEPEIIFKEGASSNYFGFNASISDEQGNLLIYSEKLKDRMNFGENTSPNINTRFAELNIPGNEISEEQFLPFFDENKYIFLFVHKPRSEFNALKYITITNNNGNYEIEHDPIIIDTNLSTYTVTGASDNDSYFIAVSLPNYNESQNRIYQINSSNFSLVNEFKADSYDENIAAAFFDLKFNPLGTKLAGCYGHGRLEVMEFDNSTGTIGRQVTIIVPRSRFLVEFSPDGEILYSKDGHNPYIITQMDVSTFDKQRIEESYTIIYSQEVIEGSYADWMFMDMELAPNGKIYVLVNPYFYPNDNDTDHYLGVINCPNKLGMEANFELKGLKIWNNSLDPDGDYLSNRTLPNFPSNFKNYGLKEAENYEIPDTTVLCQDDSVLFSGYGKCGNNIWKLKDGTELISENFTLENIDRTKEGWYHYGFNNCFISIKDSFYITVEGNPEFTLSLPDTTADIGDSPYKIPIYLNAECTQKSLIPDIEATVSYSVEKYFFEESENIELLDSWADTEFEYVRFRYTENKIAEEGQNIIGYLVGTVLLTDIDSTELVISDINSNGSIKSENGSLKTNDICIQDLRVIEVDGPVDINIFAENDRLILDYNGKRNLNISVFDISGNKLYDHKFGNNAVDSEKSINISNLSSGVYFAKVETDIKTYFKKIIKLK